MKQPSPGWAELARQLLADCAELLVAETDQIGRDLRPSFFRLRRSVVFFAIAGFLGFWILGLVAAALVLLLTKWLSAWGAALAVAGFLTLLTLILLLIGWSSLKRLENPVRIAGDRLRDHLEWWSENTAAVLTPSPATPEEKDS